MKNLLLLFFLSFSLNGFCQVPADPATSESDVEDPANSNSLPSNSLVSNQIINFVLPIYNNSFVNDIPTSSMKISMSLGTNMIVDPSFNLADIGPFAGPGNTNPYFNWSQTIVGGIIVKLTGISALPLPANFPYNFTLLDQAVVRLKATTQGTSSFVCNISVNDPSLLSDTDPTNNSSSLSYTVSAPLPISYTQFNTIQVGCDIRAMWSIANEVNISKYVVEVSKAGTDFVKVAEVAAHNASDYSATFPLTDQIKANSIFVRVKAIDRDGSSHYTDVKSVSGSCSQTPVLNLYVYPNPVVSKNNINIVARQGSLNGKYVLTLIDHSGKTLKMNEIQMDNVKTYSYDFGKMLSSGKYLVRVANTDGSQVQSLSFEKL